MPSTFIHRVLENAGRFSLDPIVRHKAGHRSAYRSLRWTDLEGTATSLAKGLLKRGLKPGGRVGLLSRNRPEWLAADLGTMMAGGVVVPIPYTSGPERCRFLIEASEVDMLVVEDQVQWYKVRLNRSSRPETIILMDGPGPENDRGVVAMTDLQEAGWLAGQRVTDVLHQRLDELTDDDPATIVFTNGNEGAPKGCIISHGNIGRFLEAADLGLPMDDPVSHQSLLMLPLHHLYPRLMGCYFNLYKNIPLIIGDSLESLAENFQETKPTFFCGSPAILEKVRERSIFLAQSVGKRRFDLFLRAMETGGRMNQYKDLQQSPPYLLEKQHWLAEKLVFKKILDLFGGNLRFVISAGSLLSPELDSFFTTLGIRVVNIYGLTETLGGAMSSFDYYRPGTVGRPMPGYDIDLAPDGEILVRGNLFSGYLAQPELTKQKIRRGWFYTGDLGRWDLDGFLVVQGRKDDLMITSDGRRIHPERIESRLRSLAMVTEAVVCGHGRDYLTALLTLDREETERFASGLGIEYQSFEELVQDPMVLERVALDVAEINHKLPTGENIIYFRVVPGRFAYDKGELSATLKVRRRLVMEKYRPLIDDMYRASPAGWDRQPDPEPAEDLEA